MSCNDAPWIGDCAQRLAELLALPPNWNHAGALQVSRGANDPALQLLAHAGTWPTAPPSVSPTVSGGIQIEWRTGGLDFEIEVLSLDHAIVVYTDEVAGMQWDGEEVPLSRQVIDGIRQVAERGARTVPGKAP
jgi:hypothetical protein